MDGGLAMALDASYGRRQPSDPKTARTVISLAMRRTSEGMCLESSRIGAHTTDVIVGGLAAQPATRQVRGTTKRQSRQTTRGLAGFCVRADESKGGRKQYYTPLHSFTGPCLFQPDS